MVEILKVKARQILDSRGNPTLEAEIHTRNGFSIGMVPSGASAGIHEALELRDKENKFMGKSVFKAVKNVNEIISKKITGMEIENQRELDNTLIELDGTENKSKLGANAILAVSIAACKQAAKEKGINAYEYIAELSNKQPVMPIPQMNVINGGKHAGMENDIQEHMIMPVKAESYSQALQIGVECYHALQKIIKKKFGATGILIGDEGGFSPPVQNTHDRLELIQKALEEAGYQNEVFFALDSASSEFYNEGKYSIGEKTYSSEELVDYYKDLMKTYKIISLEDGMAEEDWKGWQLLTKELGGNLQVVGDDLLVTNVKRIEKAIESKACNAVLLKLNQIGTVSETINAFDLAEENNFAGIVSHRSGETEDPFIADLCVGLGAGQSKFGSPARSDRTSKYNQLLRIEEQLGEKARYGKEK